VYLSAFVEEERLAGGNTHAEVVRIGATVRRPTGPWTPGVHALLAHLERRCFTGAPRALGVDDQGREVLTYVPGEVVWPDHVGLVAPDAALAEVAATIRAFHDAVAGCPWLGDVAWSSRGADPRGPAEILCHNDLAPWNLVRRPDGGWTFIDWDLAAPGRRSWDLAWALLSLVPLMPDRAETDARIRERIAIFRVAYGAAHFPADVLTVAVERCRAEAGRIERLGATGEEPDARLLDQGHAVVWRDAAGHIEAGAPVWQAALAP
jgi:hypothetical protein